MKQIYKGLIVCFFILISSGCKTTTPSILTSVCQAPCWNEIVPGVTTQADLISKLSKIPTINSKSIVVVPRQGIYTSRVVLEALSGEKIEVGLIDEKVVVILFSGKLNLSFGEAIDKYGEPEDMLVFGSIGRGFLWGDAIHTFVHAISPSKGIMFGYDASEAGWRWQSEIGSGVKLDRVYYFDPKNFDRLADAGLFSLGNANAKETKAAMVPWSGYGKIGEKYPYAHK